ncbi:MAG: NADH-quinone oxidoreductase subunit C, partial [Acidobacteriaceae bacterium]|nr:NADH-quinone oxidoreductase subunit C [Acidobacteriaceae bacterium]
MPSAVVADQEIQNELGVEATAQAARDGIPTVWLRPGEVRDTVRRLRESVPQPFRMLYDLTAIDERGRRHRDGQPSADFTVVYHLFSYDRNAFVRLKVPLEGDKPALPSIVDLCPAANWYEREVWDMFGIAFEGHPHLTRILMPRSWEGHPLRKDHPARATE